MSQGAVPTSISACVVNYQGRSRLRGTLGALFESDTSLAEVVLVDSASTDGSVELVRRLFPTVRVVELERNLGPAVARNRGLSATTGDLVLFVDNDVMVAPGCIGGLARAMLSHENVVVALPRVVSANDPSHLEFEGAEPHFLGLMSLRRPSIDATPEPAGTAAVGSMISACFLLHRGRWGKDPPFDESFGFNYEDHDFGLRCTIRGLRIVATPTATCRHGDGTLGLSVRGGASYPPTRVYHLVRGRWVILLKSFQLSTLVILAPALAVYEIVQFAFVIRRGWAREWARAVGWVITNLPDVVRARGRVQAGRAQPDRAFLVGGRTPFRPELPRGALERIGLGLVDLLLRSYWRLARRVI